MKLIPNSNTPLVLRTDFGNQKAWEEICTIIRKPVGVFRFRANVEFYENAEYEGITWEQLQRLLPKNYDQGFIILVDKISISQPGHPLLVVDLFQGSGQAFRAIPSAIQGIENNLSIANMDFEEFAGAVDEDGVFRGFRVE